MGFLAPLASMFGFELEAAVDKVRRKAIVAALLGALLALAGVFVLIAIYIAISVAYGPLIGAIVMAGIFLVLALGVYLASQIGSGARKLEERERRRKNEANAVISTAAVAAIPAALRSPILRRLGLPALAVLGFMYYRQNRRY